MKRSEINAAIRGALELFNEYKISLPPFLLWTPDEWKTKGAEADEIRENVYEGIEMVKKASIHTVMITGDNKDTAYSVVS